MDLDLTVGASTGLNVKSLYVIGHMIVRVYHNSHSLGINSNNKVSKSGMLYWILKSEAKDNPKKRHSKSATSENFLAEVKYLSNQYRIYSYPNIITNIWLGSIFSIYS